MTGFGKALLVVSVLSLPGMAQQQQTGSAVSVSNFPNPQHVVCDSGCIGSVGAVDQGAPNAGGVLAWPTTVVNFPSSYAVTGSVTISNFPATYAVTQSTSPWITSRDWALTFAGDKADVSGSNVSVSNFPASYAVTGAFYQATQPVSGTFWQATQPVSGSFYQATQPVSGTFYQATQPVSLTTLPALVAGSAVIGHVVVDTAPTTAVTGTFYQSTQPVSLSTLPALTAGSAVIGHVVVDTAPTTAVTGTFWQSTQPTSIADGQAVTIGTKTDAASTATDTTSTSVVSILKELSAKAQAPASTPVTGTFYQVTQPVSEADGQNVILGAKADAKSTATDTTVVSMMSVLKEISAMEQAPASQAVTGTFWQATQPVSKADGQDVTLGAKADAKSTATDTTPISAISVLKEISAVEQAPVSRAVTNAGTFAVQATQSGTWSGLRIVGNSGTSLDGTTAGIVDVEDRPSTSSSVALSASEKATLTTSVNVKSTAGNVYGMSAVNGAASVCWVQFINNSGNGTVGTGVIFSIPLPASGVVNLPPGALALSNFSSGIAVGIATTATGASACGTAGNVTVFYN